MRTYRPFSWYLNRAVFQVLVFMTVAYAALSGAFDSPGPDGDVMDNRPHATGSPAEMVERYDCWKDEAPADMAGTIPGHVIIRFNGVGDVVHGGPKAVSKAFAQIFDGADTQHEIFGFCR